MNNNESNIYDEDMIDLYDVKHKRSDVICPMSKFTMFCAIVIILFIGMLMVVCLAQK